MNGLRSRQGQTSGLRAARSESQKEATLASNRNRGPGAPIVVVDDDDEVEVSSARDDEVEVSSARSFAQARNSSFQRVSRAPVINDEDLELRLGLTGSGTTAGTVRTLVDHNARRKHNRVPPNKTIVLCDDGGEFDHNDSKKRKHGQQVGSDDPSNEVRELQLTCAICMSAMEEETSTVCGHIFCKKCITSAIQLQRKCPTCRKKLTINNIHRIYLSSSTS